MSAGVEDDNDLTNLAWLPNVSSIFPLSNEKSPQSSTSATNTTAKRSKSNAKTKESLNSMATSEPKKLLVHQKTNVDELAEKHEKLKAKSDFLRDASAKPPYSYAALICLAMKDTKKKMTLSQVYKWIEENFAYYRSGDKCWQNSIRHNLSLNKCFLKLPRTKEEPGKGGFWTLNPKYQQSTSIDVGQVNIEEVEIRAPAKKKKKKRKRKNSGKSPESTKICLKFVRETKMLSENTETKETTPQTSPPSDPGPPPAALATLTPVLPFPDATPAIKSALKALNLPGPVPVVPQPQEIPKPLQFSDVVALIQNKKPTSNPPPQITSSPPSSSGQNYLDISHNSASYYDDLSCAPHSIVHHGHVTDDEYFRSDDPVTPTLDLPLYSSPRPTKDMTATQEEWGNFKYLASEQSWEDTTRPTLSNLDSTLDLEGLMDLDTLQCYKHSELC